MPRLLLPSEDRTAALAARLAPLLRPGDALLLSGPLGAGKSAFARALIRARLGDPSLEVPSPSFTLVQTYGEGADTIWHADLHRLSGPAEALELGLAEAFETAIVLVEWPERLGPLVPPGALRLAFAPGEGEAERLLRLDAPPAWEGRLAPVLAGPAHG